MRHWVKKMRLCAVAALMIALAAASGQHAAAMERVDDAPRISIDGSLLSADAAPINVDGHIIVPMRVIFEALGAELTWDNETKTVLAKREHQLVSLTAGSDAAVFNGITHSLSVPAMIVEGRMYVPLRFVTESLGAGVYWDNAAKIAYITRDPAEQSADEAQAVVEAPSDSAETLAEEDGPRSIAAIREKWRAYKPEYHGNPFKEKPSLTAPHQPGELEQAFIEDGVRMANFVRYLAEVPDHLVADDALNAKAQHGAVLLSAHGRLTHTPPKPEDMAQDFYERGYASTTSSNISYYSYSTTADDLDDVAENFGPAHELSLASSVKRYMSDEDAYNLPAVGHRRWILNPQLRKIGFGYSHELSRQGMWHTIRRYSAMQVFPESNQSDRRVMQADEFDFDYILWPNRGYFPVEFFGGADPWSVSLNPERYQAPQLEQVTVTVTRESDGRTWQFQQSDNVSIEAISAEKNFFNVNTDHYGVPYSIIFRPAGIAAYAAGEAYHVHIEGIVDRRGEPAEVAYEVAFFELEGYE